LRAELLSKGIDTALADEVLSAEEFPSLTDVVNAKMKNWKLYAPLQSRDAVRLFRAVARLGFDEDSVREEIEKLQR